MNQDAIPETELNNTDKIRNAIAGNPSVTQKGLRELTGLSGSGVRYILQQMRAASDLEHIEKRIDKYQCIAVFLCIDEYQCLKERCSSWTLKLFRLSARLSEIRTG
jgi:hypothetical protein